MILTVDPKAAVPVSEQIAEGIRFAIADGRLAAGERLPSVRALARDLLVNPNTVAKVYRDLERDGVLRTRPGSGVFVAEGAERLCRKESTKAVAEAARVLVSKARAAGLDAGEIEKLVEQSLIEAGAMSHVR
jgi:GntR family transcriptional regulator